MPVVEGGRDIMRVLREAIANGQTAEIFSSDEFGFKTCYDEVVRSYGRDSGSDLVSLNGMLESLKVYSNNLYGLYLARDKAVNPERLDFFKEAYVFCFALEVASVFSGSKRDDLLRLQLDLQSIDERDFYYSERLALRLYLSEWILIKSEGLSLEAI